MPKVIWILSVIGLSCSTVSAPLSPDAPAAPAKPSTGTGTVPEKTLGFRLPALFGDHMVLQQLRETPLWGWDRPAQTVTVSIGEQARSARAAADGRWEVTLPALPAGGPHTIVVVGSETRRIDDVLVGDVWLASGQSNMEFELGRASDAAAAIAEARRPEIRMFTVKRHTAGAPAVDVEGVWHVSTPETAPRFSAVAYFFAETIQTTLGFPVGVIHSSWGGTPAEAWTSRTALAARPETKPLADRYKAGATPEAQAEYERAKAAWRARVYCKDPGNKGLGLFYAERELDDSRWKELEVPGIWQERGLAINGAVWFRHPFVVEAKHAQADFELELGPIDDFDETYVNGEKVGGIGPENPDAWRTPRRYLIPNAYLHAGRNVIAVRVFDHFGGGGFHGASNELRVFPAGSAAEAQSLSGAWRYHVEWSVPYPKELLGQEPKPPAGPNDQNSPGVLFDGMIAPLVPFGLRGAIWYQGESNVGRAAEYRALLPTLIADWRGRFRNDFPFYIVQLANFLERRPAPTESAWAELRDAQAKVSESVPGAGLAVTIDIGEGADIHPKNKRDVGKRLALLALAKTYGKAIEHSGPTVQVVRREPGKLVVVFGHADGGLRLAGKTKKVTGFAIAAADKKFVWADARLDGSSVVLSNKLIEEPVFVRYAWADNPEANVVNKENLPAAPFEAEGKVYVGGIARPRESAR
jgi:sialate O-acetylesterase